MLITSHQRFFCKSENEIDDEFLCRCSRIAFYGRSNGRLTLFYNEARKSYCMNARGIPPAPHNHPAPDQGGGTVPLFWWGKGRERGGGRGTPVMAGGGGVGREGYPCSGQEGRGTLVLGGRGGRGSRRGKGTPVLASWRGGRGTPVLAGGRGRGQRGTPVLVWGTLLPLSC